MTGRDASPPPGPEFGSQPDDGIEPWTRAEAAKFCRMHVNTFDKKVRPNLRAVKIGNGRNATVYFLKADVKAYYARLFRAAPAAKSPSADNKRRRVLERLNVQLARRGLPPVEV